MAFPLEERARQAAGAWPLSVHEGLIRDTVLPWFAVPESVSLTTLCRILIPPLTSCQPCVMAAAKQILGGDSRAKKA